jgi:hypothetical protein
VPERGICSVLSSKCFNGSHVTTNGERLTCGSFSLGKTVHFGSLECITDCFDSLSLAPKGNDSGAIFMGITCSGLPSMCTILKDSTYEFYTTTSEEGSSGFPISQRCSMGTPLVRIMTTLWLEDALTPETMATVLLRNITSWLDTELPPER